MAKIEVKMPKMGESITEGTVITWYKQPGEAIELDETLLEIGTDKVDTEVPSPAAGVLHEILVPEGETVDVGVTIALLETEADAPVASTPAAAPPAAAPAVEEQPTAPEPVPQASAPAPAASGSGEKVVVVMPKMGESITEGTVITWHKQPGETVELDETLLEIGTDKVDTEVPSPAAGTLVEILVGEGETVDVGTDIAIIAAGSGAQVSTQPAAPAPEPTASPAPVETPSIVVPSEKVETAPAGDGALVTAAAEVTGDIPRRGPEGQFFSPLVRSIAAKEGLSVQELTAIAGSGREGRVTKQDVLSYVEQRKAAPATPAAPKPAAQPAIKPATPTIVSGDRVELVKMDRMRQIIAEHMVRSKATSAHVTSFAEVDVTNLVKVRERNKASFLEREGTKLTYTPFLVAAAVEALREHPVVNASVDGTNIIIKKDYHIGIAVAIDKSRLVVPVIRNAGQLNLAGIAHASAELAERARNKRLQPDDLQGGTFTVTNVGSIGSLMGTPIINQPQVAILATGAIKKRPVVVEDPDLGDIIAIRHIMFVSLSYDHRIIDGAMASSFLRKYVEILEAHDPNALL